jgi:hypothetical protein
MTTKWFSIQFWTAFAIATIVIGLWVFFQFFTITRIPSKNTNDTSSVDASANIVVTIPKQNDVIGNILLVRGRARVFENQFHYRLRDQNNAILVEGNAYANAPDVGKFGDFEIKVGYPKPYGTNGILEVFHFSAKDGSEQDKVKVPVRFSK